MITLSLSRPRRSAPDATRRAIRTAACTVRRIAALLASSLLLAGAAHAQSRIAALEPTPAIVPARADVANRIAIAELNGSPVGAPGTGFTFSFPAGAVYRGPVSLPAGVSCNATVPVEASGPLLVSVKATGCVLPLGALAGALIVTPMSAPLLTVIVLVSDEPPPSIVAVTDSDPSATVPSTMSMFTVWLAASVMPEHATLPGPALPTGTVALQLTPAGRDTGPR